MVLILASPSCALHACGLARARATTAMATFLCINESRAGGQTQILWHLRCSCCTAPGTSLQTLSTAYTTAELGHGIEQAVPEIFRARALGQQKEGKRAGDVIP